MGTIEQALDWLNKNQGATSAILTLVTVVLTGIYVAATFYLVRLTNKQLAHAIAIEAQRVRPHVVFEILSNNGVVTASLRNLGQTSARNLRVKLEPDLKCLLGGKNCIPAAEREESMPLTSHPIASLAPGRELTGYVAFWDRFFDRYPELRFGCVVSYDGLDGTRYTESTKLDLAGHKNLKTIKVKGLPDVVASLEEISDSLGRLSRGTDVPMVRTIDEAEYAKKQAEIFSQAAKEFERLKAKDGNSTS